jgi:hypothetical protein
VEWAAWVWAECPTKNPSLFHFLFFRKNCCGYYVWCALRNYGPLINSLNFSLKWPFKLAFGLTQTPEGTLQFETGKNRQSISREHISLFIGRFFHGLNEIAYDFVGYSPNYRVCKNVRGNLSEAKLHRAFALNNLFEWNPNETFQLFLV